MRSLEVHNARMNAWCPCLIWMNEYVIRMNEYVMSVSDLNEWIRDQNEWIRDVRVWSESSIVVHSLRNTVVSRLQCVECCNVAGPFLLTNLLMDLMVGNGKPSRIVSVSSRAHYRGTIQFDDLMSTNNYSSRAAYAQSKLANVLFTRELAKRLQGLLQPLVRHPRI